MECAAEEEGGDEGGVREVGMCGGDVGRVEQKWCRTFCGARHGQLVRVNVVRGQRVLMMYRI